MNNHHALSIPQCGKPKLLLSSDWASDIAGLFDWQFNADQGTTNISFVAPSKMLLGKDFRP